MPRQKLLTEESNASPKEAFGLRAPAQHLVDHCLKNSFEAMLAAEGPARAGDDPEGVHEMRVATRRIRAALRAFKRLLPAEPRRAFQQEFEWLGNVLGAVRDLDVYRDDLQRYLDAIPAEDAVWLADYQSHLSEQWHQARNQLQASLSGQRYQTLRQRFAEFLQQAESGNDQGPGGIPSVSDVAGGILGKRLKKVLREGRAIGPETPDDALHQLRINCKRLRYLFEFLDPVHGARLQPFIKQLKKLQDVLGEFQDARTAMDKLREYAGSLPLQESNRGQFIALGELICIQCQRADRYRTRFHKVWSRFDAKRQRKQMRYVVSCR